MNKMSVESWTAVSPQSEQQLVSVSQPAPKLTPQAVLRHAHGKPRFFWQDASIEQNHEPVVYAAFGIAANLNAWGQNRFLIIQEKAAQLFKDAYFNDAPAWVETRLFGGFSFRDDFAPDNTWSIYHPAQFVLPHFQLTQKATETWLTVNALIGLDESPHEMVEALQMALDELMLSVDDMPLEGETAVSMPTIQYPMPFDIWAKNINEAVHLMKTTELNKVVLSRICELKFEQSIDIENGLNYLLKTYPDCYTFLFEPRPGHAFIGATPELLARVNGRKLTTMGLAGSVARGQTEAEAQQFAAQLRNSQKDQHEHKLVVDAMRERLIPLTESRHIPTEPDVLRFSNIQHLYTPIEATLNNDDGILPLIEQLHPTPALGGSPRPMAMSFIKQSEPVPRGWYAAPIGTLTPTLDGAFGVAIRSAAIQDRRAWLYAGAGMVADSDPELEWDETELKFKPMKNALGVE
ncbi:MAG: isochorismate synthase [Chloroflexota bacterium]